MKVGKNQIEFLAIIFLYIFALYLWTLPIQAVKLPFGDVDSSSHFVIGDLMVEKNKAILEQPYHVKFRYYGQNQYHPTYLWYPPQYWTLTGMLQIFGGERIVPVFLGVAIFSLAILLTSFLFIRELFGFWIAFLSSLLLIFSTRDYMIYLWGQWPQSLSYGLTPLVLYCYYKYWLAKLKKEKSIYLYLIPIFIAGQFFFHPQGLVASIATLITATIMLVIKHRKIIEIKEIILAIILFIAITSIFAPFNVGEFWFELFHKDEALESKQYQFDRLFKWYHIKKDAGLPDFYFTYNKTHGSLQNGILNRILSWWTLPFLLLGIIVLVHKRNNEHIILLGWLIAYYFLTRLSVFGMGQRDIRMFAFEAHVFYPIIALGLLSLSSISIKFRRHLKYGLIIVFIILALSVNGKSAYNTLKGMQYSITRINPYQYEAAGWIKNNIQPEENVYDIGTFSYAYYGAKIKWLSTLSQRHFIMEDKWRNITNYIFLDYSDAILLQDQNQILTLQGLEKNLANLTLVYNKNNIRVYKIGNISKIS